MSGVSRALPFPVGDDIDIEDDSVHSLPVLHWLQVIEIAVAVVLMDVGLTEWERYGRGFLWWRGGGPERGGGVVCGGGGGDGVKC